MCRCNWVTFLTFYFHCCGAPPSAVIVARIGFIILPTHMSFRDGTFYLKSHTKDLVGGGGGGWGGGGGTCIP